MKRSKTNNNNSENEEPVKKVVTKGKGKKGKRYVLYYFNGLILVVPTYNLSVG